MLQRLGRLFFCIRLFRLANQRLRLTEKIGFDRFQLYCTVHIFGLARFFPCVIHIAVLKFTGGIRKFPFGCDPLLGAVSVRTGAYGVFSRSNGGGKSHRRQLRGVGRFTKSIGGRPQILADHIETPALFKLRVRFLIIIQGRAVILRGQHLRLDLLRRQHRLIRLSKQ